MLSIYLLLADLTLPLLWKQGIEKHYNVIHITKIPSTSLKNSILIIDAKHFEKNRLLLEELKQVAAKFLIIGDHWPEDQQVHALMQGAAGYCEADVSATIMRQAISSIANGGIWIQRHLIQQVIGSLINLNEEKKQTEAHQSKKQLSSLSPRELEVAEKVATGENNKKIAQALSITERTVKAHLTAVFRKLNVHDRLHLALFIKDNQS